MQHVHADDWSMWVHAPGEECSKATIPDIKCPHCKAPLHDHTSHMESIEVRGKSGFVITGWDCPMGLTSDVIWTG